MHTAPDQQERNESEAEERRKALRIALARRMKQVRASICAMYT